MNNTDKLHTKHTPDEMTLAEYKEWKANRTASKQPWRLVNKEGGDQFWYIEDADGVCVGCYDADELDQKLIVEAVNNHTKLVKENEALQAKCERYESALKAIVKGFEAPRPLAEKALKEVK